MKTEAIIKANASKVLMGVFGVWCIIYIARSGYQVGQFLYEVLH
ncbi:MAG TPA: hypothetical protein VD884_00180 [Ohtaekwangia sp.]|nr:hypothetical protein [Ohtaekwangia sp.]